MLKLYVDDIRNAPDESWALARTIRSAVTFIHQFGLEIEEISLDHDISHQVSIGTKLERPFPCEETFASVAYFIGAYYKSVGKKPKVSIHTSNPSGAQTMEYILAQYGIHADIKMLPGANRLEMEV